MSDAANSWYQFNIGWVVRWWYDGTYPNHGLVLQNDPEGTTNNIKNFYSSNYTGNSSLRPKLVIKYNNLPTATTVSPISNVWLTENTPTFNWSYSDPDGDPQASYQVQVFNLSGTKVRDSGIVSSDAKSWTPTNLSDGNYTWKVRVYDGIGWSDWVSNSFRIDISDPTATLKINSGAAYTNTKEVTLNVSGSDSGSGVSKMRFKEGSGNWTSWESYSSTKAWTLVSGQGQKTVYVQVKDSAGNTSSTSSATITLDTQKPTGSFQINDGASVTDSQTVTLSILGSDNLSAVTNMSFSNNGVNWTSWEAFKTTRQYNLPAGDGLKTVYTRLRDGAGNISNTFSQSIFYLADGQIGGITLSVYAPAEEEALSDITNIIGEADSTIGISFITLEISGYGKEILAASASSSPFALSLDTRSLKDGDYTIKVTAYDSLSNTEAVEIPVSIDNNPEGMGTDKATASTGVDFYVGGQVNLLNGNVYFSAQDLYVDSMSPELKAERAYNHQSRVIGEFGLGTSLALPKLSTLRSGDVLYTDETGREEIFKEDDGAYISPNSVPFELSKNEEGYLLTTLDRTEYLFDSDGRLESMADSNGNTTTFVYDANKNLTQIKDDTGQYVSLIYDSGIIKSAEDHLGRKVSYAYDSAKRLIKTEDIGGNTASYKYTQDGLIEVSNALGQTYTLDYEEGKLISVADPLEHKTIVSYEENSAAVTLANGATYKYYLDEKGRTIKSVDPMGAETTLSYDDADNILEQTDALGNSTSYTYDEKGRTLTQTDALGGTLTYEYDEKGNLTKEINQLGAETTYTYDERGNTISEIDALGNTSTNTYDEHGNQTSSTDALGHTTTANTDEKGNVVEDTDELGNITKYEFDAYGNRTKEISPLGAVETTTYNIYGLETSTTDPLGRTSAVEYDALGREIKETSIDGQVTEIIYNAAGQTVEEKTPLGSTKYEYDEIGNRTKETDPQGEIQTYTYDETGHHLMSTTNMEGNTTEYKYDMLGRQTETVDANGGITKTEYDALGRVTSQTNAEGETSKTTYDAAGNTLSTTTPNGETTNNTYDLLGRVVEVTKPDGTSVSYIYDAGGNKASETNANGQTTTYTYDPKGQLTAETSAAGATTTYTYDVVGNQISTTTPDGQTTTLEYNLGVELTKKIEPSGDETTYKYDNAGRLTEETTKEGTTTYTYNELGQLVSKQEPGQEPQDLTYDTAGRVTQKSVMGRTFNYTYDKLSRLTSNSDELAGLFGYSYDKVGNLTTSTKPNSINTNYDYDKSNRLTQLSNVILREAEPTEEPPVSEYQYTYDKNGNRTETSERQSDSAAVLQNKYSYDSRGQMTYSEEQINHEVYPHTKYTWYTFDNNGNRKAMEAMLSTSNPSKGNKKGITEIIQRVIEQDPELNKPGIEDSIIQILEFLLTGQPKQKGAQDGLTKTVTDVISGTPFTYEYTYNNEDQLTKLYDPVTDKEYSYAYDLKGNLTSKQDYYGDYSYTWDYRNRLIEVRRSFAPDGAQDDVDLTIKYTYDSKDRRTSKTVIDSSSSFVIPVRVSSTTYSYKYDGWAVMEETILRSFVGADAPPQDDEEVKIRYTYSGDSPIAITLGSDTYYYITDGHGDVREVTDSAGNTLVKYSYDAWGSPTTVILSPQGEESQEGGPSATLQDDVASLNPYRYTGYRYDSDTGMYYLRARYYDPVTGRFLSKDPIPYENLYVYCANNPINAKDPSGKVKTHELSSYLMTYWDQIPNVATKSRKSQLWGKEYFYDKYIRIDMDDKEDVTKWSSYGNDIQVNRQFQVKTYTKCGHYKKTYNYYSYAVYGGEYKNISKVNPTIKNKKYNKENDGRPRYIKLRTQLFYWPNVWLAPAYWITIQTVYWDD